MATTYTTNIPSNFTYTIPTSSGISNSTLTSTGTYSTAWTGTTSNYNSTNGNTVMTIPFGEDKVQIEKSATLEVKGNIVLNGMDLDDRLKTIEKVLCIPQRDVTMETKYPKLAELYKQYMHELEKYQTWESIKGDDNGTT